MTQKSNLKVEDFVYEGSRITFEYCIGSILYYSVGRPIYENRTWEIYIFPISVVDLDEVITRNEDAIQYYEFIEKAIKEGWFILDDNGN